MANTGYGTASEVLKGVGGMASMIPVYGQAVGAGLSAVGGILDMVDAQKQKEEAGKIQRKAEQVKKQPLEKEYLQALRGQKMLALSGLPEYDRAKQNIDLGAANALKSIKEASPYGGSVVDAINAVLNKGSQQKADIDVQQAQAKLGLQKDVLNTLYNVGGLQRELTKEQRTRQEALYSQAQDLMAASTANKQIGREKALGAGIQGVGALAKMLGSAGGENTFDYGSLGAEQDSQEPIGLQDKPSTLMTQGTTIGQQGIGIKLDPKELGILIGKLKDSGEVKDKSEGLQYLRKMGFNV